MRDFYQKLTLYGKVSNIAEDRSRFTLQTRSGDSFEIRLRPQCDPFNKTRFELLTNLDLLNRDRTAAGESDAERYLAPGERDRYVAVIGVYQEHENERCLTAEVVHLFHSSPGNYLFEHTHWWITQISLMANQWLDNLFKDTRSYRIDDYSKFYRTNLNITGAPTDNTIQECATLSRLIYGLSSAYLLTGSDRYLEAARAGVQYQRDAFRSLSHDGQYCFWAFGRRAGSTGSKLVMVSDNEDDRGTIPLYEQIYALAGLSQFYRITQDRAVLDDIRRTVRMFMEFYHDGVEKRSKNFPGHGGFFSHIDPVTMRPDYEGLYHNRLRKNWNSIGDHIPAYLVNLVLALDPLGDDQSLKPFLDECRAILEETADLIIERFVDPENDYVNERFHADWLTDSKWRWQKDRAVVGHNLKIAWNLTRVAFYYNSRAHSSADLKKSERDEYDKKAKRALEKAREIGKKMADRGLDKIRGGVWDAVERAPSNGLPVEFSWQSTKDFWQQEQGALAYLILHGAEPSNPLWLQLARECEAFWNLFFLDRDRQGIFFRTNENGDPIINGDYANKGGHSISGYHAFELNYLAHLYTRAFVASAEQQSEQDVPDTNFCLYFKVPGDCGSINVLPDFVPPRRLRISAVRCQGVDRGDLVPKTLNDFQIRLNGAVPHAAAKELVVEFAVSWPGAPSEVRT